MLNQRATPRASKTASQSALSRSRPAVLPPTHALGARNGWLQALESFLPALRGESRPSRRLKELLLAGAADPREVWDLVDEVAATTKGRVLKEQTLGGGPWVVRCTRGPIPFLWNATWRAGQRLVNANNTASQAFDPRVRSVVNRVEYVGAAVAVSASGTYQPLDPRGTLPLRVRADISAGALALWGWECALPIAGSGEFEILYCDGDVRIFKSAGGTAVQVRQSLLAQGSKGNKDSSAPAVAQTAGAM